MNNPTKTPPKTQENENKKIKQNRTKQQQKRGKRKKYSNNNSLRKIHLISLVIMNKNFLRGSVISYPLEGSV